MVASSLCLNMLKDLAVLDNIPHCDCSIVLACVRSGLSSITRRLRRGGLCTVALPCSVCAVLFRFLRVMYHRGVKEEARRHGFSKPALISMEQWPVLAGLSSLPGILLSLGGEGAPGVRARGVCILQLGLMVLRMGEML